MSAPELVFVAKGLLSGLGVLLLVYHMDKCWDGMRDGAQRARYLCLLGFGVLVAGASTEQIAEGATLEARHWASLAMSAALVCVALYSIRKAREKR